jgi:hypothetical protein
MLTLPVIFGVLTAAALVAALAALWWSVRSTLGGAEEAALDLGEDSSERTALLETKRSLLRALKDLEHERQVGKLDEVDYQRLSETYRARAKEVLAQLDQDLGPYLEKARALTGVAEVSGKAYRARGAAKAAKAPEAAVAKEAPEEEEEDEAEQDEDASTGDASKRSTSAGDEGTEALAAKLASLPEHKRREAEAFLAKLAGEAASSSSSDEDASSSDEAPVDRVTETSSTEKSGEA